MQKFMSRKLIAMIVGAIAVGILQHVGAAPQTISDITGLIALYIGGQSVADAAASLKNPNLTSQGA